MNQLSQRLALTAALLLVTTGPVWAAEDASEAFDPTIFAARAHQLQMHQGLALATLGSMAATAGLGLWSHRGGASAEWREIHLGLAGLTTGLYVSTASLAWLAPQQNTIPDDNALSSVNIHQTLGWLHAAGLLGTVGLGLAVVMNGNSFVPAHGLLGGTTLGLMAASAGIVAFGQ